MVVISAGFLLAALLFFVLPSTPGVTGGIDVERRLISGVLTAAFLLAVVWLVKGRK
ncbi:hypothetical protein [Sphingomonas hankyongi]|uniref:Uncharacterized protein n=1 Tax=Sphingomonas hankyongi TaxID=2908209 RepID=A0ABT0RYI8_9SPHN|nr:hypothetical protein [Sphingomonas hankyongi]MCL6728531.1 hypothetical protein [Sphingomonas hankyongi]